MKITYVLKGRECTVKIAPPQIARVIARLERLKATKIVRVR